MDIYTATAYKQSELLTLRYSTSFGMSSRLFSKDIRHHIYALYGLVRIADEIVDTYKGADAATLLDELEAETYAAIKRGYSTNPIVHSFALTAARFSINHTLLAPFFESMRLDLSPQTYTPKLYTTYIHGSAEVIGLLCLKIFCGEDEARYKKLKNGAASLGAAYQKINFLRDIAADYKDLGRIYFPNTTFDSFDEAAKAAIIADIHNDLAAARPALSHLPGSSKKAATLSYRYYSELLARLEATPAETLKTTRIRLPSRRKYALLASTLLKPTSASKDQSA